MRVRSPVSLADCLNPAGRLEIRPPVEVLQPADVVGDRRGARLDAPVSAADMPARKHFLLRLEILQPLLSVLVERSRVGLQEGTQSLPLPMNGCDAARCVCSASALRGQIRNAEN